MSLKIKGEEEGQVWVFLLSELGFVSVCQHSCRGGDH